VLPSWLWEVRTIKTFIMHPFAWQVGGKRGYRLEAAGPMVPTSTWPQIGARALSFVATPPRSPCSWVRAGYGYGRPPKD